MHLQGQCYTVSDRMVLKDIIYRVPEDAYHLSKHNRIQYNICLHYVQMMRFSSGIICLYINPCLYINLNSLYICVQEYMSIHFQIFDG